MAKLSFTKLGLKINQDIKTIEYNGQNIEVKQYLSLSDKLDIMSEILTKTANDENYANPLKIDVLLDLAIVENYTNITFTEKQKEDIYKLYDLCVSNGLIAAVKGIMNEQEIKYLYEGIYKAADAIYGYKNSLMGILQTIASDYSTLDLEATDIQQKLADPENMTLLRGVLSKLS